MIGLVTWADHYLLSFEKNERQQNDLLRRAALLELTGSGRVGSEGEIKKWLMANRDKQLEMIKRAQSRTMDKEEHDESQDNGSRPI